MIFDKTSNLTVYRDLFPRLANYQQFLKDNETTPVGRYELPEGDFVMIQEGTTKPISEGKFEAHRRFLDLQIVVAGGESIQWQAIHSLAETQPYDEKTDKINYQGSGELLTITAGMFYVMYPEDGHMACVHKDQASPYRKFVFKIKI